MIDIQSSLILGIQYVIIFHVHSLNTLLDTFDPCSCQCVCPLRTAIVALGTGWWYEVCFFLLYLERSSNDIITRSGFLEVVSHCAYPESLTTCTVSSLGIFCYINRAALLQNAVLTPPWCPSITLQLRHELEFYGLMDAHAFKHSATWMVSGLCSSFLLSPKIRETIQ